MTNDHQQKIKAALRGIEWVTSGRITNLFGGSVDDCPLARLRISRFTREGPAIGASRTSESETLSRALPGNAVPWTPGNRFVRSEDDKPGGFPARGKMCKVARLSGARIQTVSEFWKHTRQDLQT